MPEGLSYATEGTKSYNNTFVLNPKLYHLPSGAALESSGFWEMPLNYDSFYLLPPRPLA